MPRPLSDDKRTAILSAATRVIVEQGLGATTAGIAKEAGIASGSLFTYYETKIALLNALYLEYKTEITLAAAEGMSDEADLHQSLSLLWRNWMHWAITFPEKRKVLSLLSVADEISPATRQAANKVALPIAGILEKVHRAGPMRYESFSFVMSLMNSVADGTMNAVTEQPEMAEQFTSAGFYALWRMMV